MHQAACAASSHLRVPTPPRPSSKSKLPANRGVSQDDTTQSGTANVMISLGANILSLHPSSVYAGAADGFTIRVTGSGFVPSIPGPGSALLVGGTSRATTCDTAYTCSAPVNSTDVVQAGNLKVQIQNPDATKSNLISLVVVPPSTTEDVIVFSNSAPGATGKDITVVEPTSAGLDSPDSNLDMEVAAVGVYVSSTSTCNLAGNPIPLPRP